MYSPLIYDIHWKLHKKEMHIIQQFYLRIIAKAPAGTNINIPLAITSQLPMHEVDTKVCSYLNRYNHEATYPIPNYKCVTHPGPQKKELIELLRRCTQTSPILCDGSPWCDSRIYKVWCRWRHEHVVMSYDRICRHAFAAFRLWLRVP